MPAESITAPVAGTKTIPRGDLFGDATALLVRAAAPERRHLIWGVVWLVLAAGLEALGPLIGSRSTWPYTPSRIRWTDRIASPASRTSCR